MCMSKCRSRAVAILLLAAGLASAGDAVAQYPNEDYPIPATPKQDLTAIQRTFAPPSPPPLTVFPAASGAVEGHTRVPSQFQIRHQFPQLLPG